MAENKQPTELEKLAAKYPFYVRIAFGLLIVFGMVGNCTGKHESVVAVFLITALMWVCLRIIQEAVDSWRVLRGAAAYEESLKKDEKSDDEDPPGAPG